LGHRERAVRGLAQLGTGCSVTYNRSFHQKVRKARLFRCSEGVLIFSVKPRGPGSQSKSASSQSKLVRPYWQRMFSYVALFLLCCIAFPVFAQQGDVISEIRVIGNRKIPKETVLARLFTRILRSGKRGARFQFVVEHGLL
jgi:outer membrane protein insertion porin family